MKIAVVAVFIFDNPKPLSLNHVVIVPFIAVTACQIVMTKVLQRAV
jgi:hypothetical protein